MSIPAQETTGSESSSHNSVAVAGSTSLKALLSKIRKSTSILYESTQFIALDKPPDLRMDGDYPATAHKLMTYWYPPPSIQQAINTRKVKKLEKQGRNRSIHHLPEEGEEQQTKKIHECEVNDEALLEELEQYKTHADHPDNELRHCHQLDYATSGVILYARTVEGAHGAQRQFQERHVTKQYVALLHGHVHLPPPSPSPSSSWSILSSDNIYQQIEQEEERYRRDRSKRKKDTFDGYQPPHMVYQMWSQQQKRQGKPGKKNKLSPTEWEMVWSCLSPMTEEEKKQVLDTGWKMVRKLNLHSHFEQAAERYNSLLLLKLKAKTEAAACTLPQYFYEQESTNEKSFYIWAPLAESTNDFAMRISPSSIVSRPGTHSNLIVCDDPSKDDLKPCLTKCTILENGQLEGHSVTKVLLEPKTGRRHQLRVHSALLGHPIVGDCTYCSADLPQISRRMCLHSYRLNLEASGETLNIEAHDPFSKQEDDQFVVDSI